MPCGIICGRITPARGNLEHRSLSGAVCDCREELITVKCQTLGPGRAVKEVDIQLPVDIFNRMLDQNGNTGVISDPLKRDRDLSLSRKIRNIFIFGDGDPF